MVVPTITQIQNQKSPAQVAIDSSDDEDIITPLRQMKVYEDPFSSNDDHTTPRPVLTAPVLSEVAFPDDVSNIIKPDIPLTPSSPTEKLAITPLTAEKSKQNTRLLESGINKIKSQTLDVHGFRKLQTVLRAPSTLSPDIFSSLLLGLFEYLEAPLPSLGVEKVQDVKAQILTTIKILAKKDREAFRPHVQKGLSSILVCRTGYDARAHIVSGLELLAEDLVKLCDPASTTSALTNTLALTQLSSVEGCRTLSMGLHILKTVLSAKPQFTPSAKETGDVCGLARRCLESTESGVRMEAVMLCVGLQERVGEDEFWRVMGDDEKGVSGDGKSLILYYIVKRRRELAATAGGQ